MLPTVRFYRKKLHLLTQEVIFSAIEKHPDFYSHCSWPARRRGSGGYRWRSGHTRSGGRWGLSPQGPSGASPAPGTCEAAPAGHGPGVTGQGRREVRGDERSLVPDDRPGGATKRKVGALWAKLYKCQVRESKSHPSKLTRSEGPSMTAMTVSKLLCPAVVKEGPPRPRCGIKQTNGQVWQSLHARQMSCLNWDWHQIFNMFINFQINGKFTDWKSETFLQKPSLPPPPPQKNITVRLSRLVLASSVWLAIIRLMSDLIAPVHYFFHKSINNVTRHSSKWKDSVVISLFRRWENCVHPAAIITRLHLDEPVVKQDALGEHHVAEVLDVEVTAHVQH